MTAGPLLESALPLPLHRKGKVREVYDVDDETVLLVTSDRISAFDVVMKEPIPHKGAVLTQISAYWFRALESITPSHFISADAKEIVERVPALEGHEATITGRAMLARRTTPVLFECVVRGYLSNVVAFFFSHGVLDLQDPGPKTTWYEVRVRKSSNDGLNSFSDGMGIDITIVCDGGNGFSSNIITPHPSPMQLQFLLRYRWPRFLFRAEPLVSAVSPPVPRPFKFRVALLVEFRWAYLPTTAHVMFSSSAYVEIAAVPA